MNLYLISQTENTGYDTYESAVVCAASEDDARSICPCQQYEGHNGWDRYTWAASPDLVAVKLIGTAAPGVERGVVCASFNAG